MIILYSTVFDTISAGDVVNISIFGVKEYSNVKIFVPPGCNSYIPLAGRLRVCGMSVEKLTDTLQKLFSPYYNLPVIITLENISPPTITVLGTVNHPGSVVYAKGMKLSDVLTQAGLTPYSDITRVRINGKTVNLKRENPYVLPGDFVEVPSKWWVFLKDNISLFINLATFGLMVYSLFFPGIK